MSERKQNDLIRSFCEGAGRRFGRLPCEHYDHSDRHCRLLEKQEMSEFWEKCRLNTLKILHKYALGYLENFIKEWNFPIEKAENIRAEDIDFKSVMTRLKKKKLTQGYTLAVWLAYVKTTIYREIKRNLARQGMIPREVRCGSCRYLSGSAPYICSKKGEPRKKTDGDNCEDYCFDIVITESGIEEKDIPPVAETPETLLEEKEKRRNPLSSVIKDALSTRIREAKPGTRKREIYKRQCEIFIELLHLISEGMPKKEAEKALAGEYNINERTIRRDIADIREFLKKKNVL
ncbi:hypothetical protein QUF80_09985 [Desulfococcaceae bacterium HSG8]|nr:hypothetical protein [Desulfococcaceae bacterium HSG8]